jgi:hypothetical protein
MISILPKEYTTLCPVDVGGRQRDNGKNESASVLWGYLNSLWPGFGIASGVTVYRLEEFKLSYQ